MRSYVCPQCGNKGPAMLVPGQVCQTCRSSSAWSRQSGSKPLVIHVDEKSMDQAEPTLRTQAPAAETEGGWALRAVPFLLLAGAVALLFCFFKALPSGSLESRLWWGQVIAVWAIGMGVLSILWSLWCVARPMRGKGAVGWGAQRILLCTAVVSAAVSLTAALCWGRTGKIYAVPLLPAGAAHPLLIRNSGATAVIYAHNERANRYRPSVGSGVVVGSRDGHTWVLTVAGAQGGPWSDLSEADEIRVGFSGGELLRGYLRWAGRPPVNLAVLEVDSEVARGRAQFRPVAEGLIPTERIFAIPNPLSSGWGVEWGEVEGRSSVRLPSGWLCRVNMNLRLQTADVGGGLFDSEGRLLGLYEGWSAGGEPQGFLITSTLAASVEAAVNSGDFSALKESYSGEVFQR